jgi:hypothetical protein
MYLLLNLVKQNFIDKLLLKVLKKKFSIKNVFFYSSVLDADLSKLLRDNYHSIASRNTEGKTPRDVALDAGLQENVDQIGLY